MAEPQRIAAENVPQGGARFLHLAQRASNAARALRRLLADVASPHDLTDAELLVIWLCADQQGVVQGELAEAIGVSPAQMSGVADGLKRRGLLDMQRSTVDRRRQVWHPTGEGHRMLAAICPRLRELAAKLDDQLPPAEQQKADELLSRLSTAADSLRRKVKLRVVSAATISAEGGAE